MDKTAEYLNGYNNLRSEEAKLVAQKILRVYRTKPSKVLWLRALALERRRYLIYCSNFFDDMITLIKQNNDDHLIDGIKDLLDVCAPAEWDEWSKLTDSFKGKQYDDQDLVERIIQKLNI